MTSINASTPLSISRRHAGPILALVAALAVGLLFLLPGGLLQAQATSETYYHHENDEGPVVTLTARDPEGVSPAVWSLLTTTELSAFSYGSDGRRHGIDRQVTSPTHASFAVENGVLKFKGKPNFEGGSISTNDEYKVVVVASDGGKTEWVQYFKVTVNVLDVEETGKVTWTVGYG